MTLVAGSYEKYIWGYSFKTLETLKPLFSYPSHSAPIKSLAAAGNLAASGAADDAIKLYDLSSASDLSSLLEHTGAVTSLSFFSLPSAPSIPIYLLSASDDGNLCIFDVDPFVHLKTVPVHRRGVLDFAVHPSGRVAVTVGRDCGFALVNLVRGRRSFSCRLDQEAGIVKYGVGAGDKFFMGVEEKIGVHDSEDARLVCELVGEKKKKVLCLAPAENGLLLAGGEDRDITVWDTNSGKVAYQIENAHSSRVKGVVIFEMKNAAQGSVASNYVASASSDGMIRVWDTRMISGKKPAPVAEANTKSRLTCLAVSAK